MQESQSTWASRAIALAMSAHRRLGSTCPSSLQEVATSRDLLLAIMKHITLIVPDDAPSLAAALKKAAPGQKVLLRGGEHLVDGRPDGGPGSSQLCVTQPVEIHGEAGTVCVLHGTIVLGKGSAGVMRDLIIEDGGDCCVRCEAGDWELVHVRLRCSHGSALLVSGSARVALISCVLGGEGDVEAGKHVTLSAYGSVQEYGLRKRACFAIVAKGAARIRASDCTLRECSEAAVLIANTSHVALERCAISSVASAFLAGEGLGKSLRVSLSAFEGTARKLWADADRPLAFEWGKGNSREEATDASDDAVGDESIVPREQPRGAAGDSSSDTDSLEDATAFANMEALMEELDNAALAS